MSEGISRESQGASPAEALQAFQWTPQPEAERLVGELVAEFLGRSSFLRTFRDRLQAEAGVRLVDLVDSLAMPATDAMKARLLKAGYETRPAGFGGSHAAFVQPHGMFPAVILHDSKSIELAIKVESVVDFVSALDFSQPQRGIDSGADVVGEPLAHVRRFLLEIDPEPTGQTSLVWAVERHGYRGFEFHRPAPRLEAILKHGTAFRLRPRRRFSSEHRFIETARLIDGAIGDVGVDYSCDLFFAAEREYWQRRNRAAQVQKARQDRLGIGWANHDHHTYRSSRKHFSRLISVFEKLGFHCRERFYAGKQAGWGAQVLEQPNAGIVIFADVDLSPDELLIDFAHEPLPERQQLGTVGLWCALHGESFLEAGMHHLECQFDFEALRKQLESEAGIKTMKPFTDFPYLRQAFTEGEWWPVREERIAKLLEKGQITPEQAETFRTKGAVGSHLENLERNQGFKGFNQTGVSEIIAATDPRKLAGAPE